MTRSKACIKSALVALLAIAKPATPLVLSFPNSATHRRLKVPPVVRHGLGIPRTATTVKSGSFQFSTMMSQSNQQNTMQEVSSVPVYVEGIRSLSTDYDIFLLDMWGVMHNGSQPYEGVIDTVRKLKEAGKKMIILSNSSKRIDDAKKVLHKLGFDLSAFDQIITSGEVSYRMLCGNDTLQCTKWDVLSNLIQRNQKKVFVFGSGDGDEEYVESCGWTLAPVEEADLIIARGTFTIQNGRGSPISSKKQDEAEYFRIMEESLDIAAERKVPMLVTNPDRVRPDKGLPPMPGAIGDAYEKVLGEGNSSNLVKRIGKPYGEVYELALLGCDNRRKAVMVGDALETDVLGGTKFECSTAWIVNDGIHSPFVKEFGGDDFEKGTRWVLDKFNHDKKDIWEGYECLSPTYIAKHFRW